MHKIRKLTKIKRHSTMQILSIMLWINFFKFVKYEKYFNIFECLEPVSLYRRRLQKKTVCQKNRRKKGTVKGHPPPLLKYNRIYNGKLPLPAPCINTFMSNQIHTQKKKTINWTVHCSQGERKGNAFSDGKLYVNKITIIRLWVQHNSFIALYLCI